jgi:hypothetical protein
LAADGYSIEDIAAIRGCGRGELVRDLIVEVNDGRELSVDWVRNQGEGSESLAELGRLVAERVRG